MKTVFLDIDGVIYEKNKINKRGLNLLNKLGIKYVFCTGRGYLRTIDIVGNYINNNSLLIVENGSKIVDYLGNILHFSELEKEEKEVIKNINLKHIKFIIYESMNFQRYISYGSINISHPIDNFTDFKEYIQNILKDKLTQITILFNCEIAKNNFLNLCVINGINATKSENYVQINHRSISKKSAIEYIIKTNNINMEDIYIVGNDYNDIPMFEIDAKEKIVVENFQTPILLKEKASIKTTFKHLYLVFKNIF